MRDILRYGAFMAVGFVPFYALQWGWIDTNAFYGVLCAYAGSLIFGVYNAEQRMNRIDAADAQLREELKEVREDTRRRIHSLERQAHATTLRTEAMFYVLPEKCRAQALHATTYILAWPREVRAKWISTRNDPDSFFRKNRSAYLDLVNIEAEIRDCVERGELYGEETVEEFEDRIERLILSWHFDKQQGGV